MSETPVISQEDAREYSESLAQIGEGWIRQVLWASRQGVPQAEGLTLREWKRKYYGHLRVPIDELPDVAAEMRDEGYTLREISDATGAGYGSVHRALNNDPDGSSDGEEDGTASGDMHTTDPHGSEANYEDVSNDELEQRASEGDAAPSEDQTAELDTSTDDVTGSEPEVVEDGEPEPEPEPAEAAEKPSGPHVANNSGDNEWYTPIEFIKAAHAVMGGIDLDPASSEAANDIIEAGAFFDENADGLRQPWHGRVWMNPPYAQPWVDKFCAQLARSYASGEVTEACVLVNNATETTWFQSLAAVASAMCFPRGRVKFWHPRKESMPLQGQSVVYLGQNVSAFKAEFLPFGFAAVIR